MVVIVLWKVWQRTGSNKLRVLKYKIEYRILLINRGTISKLKSKTANSKDVVIIPDLTPHLIDHFCKIIPWKSNSSIRGANNIV